MGYSLSQFEKKAAEAHKGLAVLAEVDGVPTDEVLFTLRSVVRLSDAETVKLNAANARLKEYQSKGDGAAKPSELKRVLVDVLAILADKPTALRSWISGLDLGVATEVFKSYQEETQAPEGN